MSISPEELEKIAKLAYLETDETLTKEINDIMDFVDKLRETETRHLPPLFHPLELHQRARPDAVTEEDCLAELMAIAPQSEDNYYLVPKILELDE